MVTERIRTHGAKVMKGDLVYKKVFKKDLTEEASKEEGGSKEDLVEVVEDAGDHTIHDVLVPIPGSKVELNTLHGVKDSNLVVLFLGQISRK